MAQSRSSMEDAQAEFHARLLVQGLKEGFDTNDDRFPVLLGRVTVLETHAELAIEQSQALYQGKKYEQAIRLLTETITEGEQYFSQYPKGLAEAAFSYALVRLYSLRATLHWAGSEQSGDRKSRLQLALTDANKALNYPAEHYQFIEPDLSNNARSLRNAIQSELETNASGGNIPSQRRVPTKSDMDKMVAEVNRLIKRVEAIKADLYHEDQGGGNPFVAEIKATQGIDVIEDFFKGYEDELTREPKVKAGFGAYLVTFRATRARLRYEDAIIDSGSRKQNKLVAASNDVEETLSYPSSFFNNPEIKPGLQALQAIIREAQNKKDGCFIATAAFGSPLAPEIIVLRHFRDTRMRPHSAGRWMIAAYERISPPFADAIAPHPAARLWVRRLLLTPAISVIRRWFP